jgi:hypothetical protein
LDLEIPESKSIQVLAGIEQLTGDSVEGEKKRYLSRVLEA